VRSDAAEPHQHTVVVVFLGSPGGLDADRAAVKDAAAELNEQLRQFDVYVDLRSGDTHGPAGGRPQDDINPDVDSCQIFIGLLWDEWGSPSGVAASGFEEEYRRITDRREVGGSLCPQPLIWFKNVPPRQRADPGPHLQKVLAFRQELTDSKADFFRDYETEAELGRQVRVRLFELIVRLTGINESPPESLQGIDSGDLPPRNPPPAPSDTALSSINWAAALTAGPVHDLPQGRERAQQAAALQTDDPAAAAALLGELAAELTNRHAGVASEELRSRAATAYWAAGRTEDAIRELLSVLRERARRSPELAAADIERLRQWLPASREWEASAWEACSAWPEHRDEARGVLAEIFAEHSQDEVARDDWLYWHLVLAELHLLSGCPSAARAVAASVVRQRSNSFEEVLLLLTSIEAEEQCGAPDAEAKWAEIRTWADHHARSDPRAAATIWARWATSCVLREQPVDARAAFARAGELWAEVDGAEDQVAEMYFAGQTADQLAGAFMPEGAEWRPIAAALRGVADTPAARASALESAGLTARVLGQAYGARGAYWLALTEHRRAGNLRGQLFLWHLLAELHEHAEHFEEAVAAYVRCGRQDEARRAAQRSRVEDVMEVLEVDGPPWQRTATLAALSSVGRRLSPAKADALAHSVLNQAQEAESQSVYTGSQPVVRAVEALAAMIFALDGRVLEEALSRLRRFANVADLRFARTACEALMLATNCGLSDETNTVLSVFVSEHPELASISSVWVGDRLSQDPSFEPVVRQAALAGRIDALEALSIAGLVEGNGALQDSVDGLVARVIRSELGRGPEGQVAGLASFEGLGIIGRSVSSATERAALARHLMAFAEGGNEPQINRASAANALFNLRSGLAAEEAVAHAARLLPIAIGKSQMSQWDATRKAVQDPFNRFRLGFTAAADELRAAALHACAALYDHAGTAPTELMDAVDDAWPSRTATVAASAWDAVAQASQMAVPAALEAALVHPAWQVRVAAVRCWTQRNASQPPTPVRERLVADESVAVRVEAVRLASAALDAQSLDALVEDIDGYVRRQARAARTKLDSGE